MDSINSTAPQHANKARHNDGAVKRYLGNAAFGGIIGATIGVGFDYFAQKSIIKDPQRIAKLQIDADSYCKNGAPKLGEELKKTISKYKTGKLDWRRLGKNALVNGAICVGLSLVFDGVMSLVLGRRSE